MPLSTAAYRPLRWWLTCLFCAGGICAALCPLAFAEEEERACDLPPFDQVVLDAANKNAVLKVEPLELPNRKLPAQPVGDLTIRLLADPTRAFDVSWQNIRQVILFEDFLLSEAKRLTAAGNYDEAFDYYARLLRDYPQQPGLGDSVNEYLRQNAMALVNSQEYDRALAVLSTLYQRAPNTAGIQVSIDTVCSKMVERQLREKDYAAARAVLNVWRTVFRGLNSPTVAAWEERFAAAAQRQIDEARQQLSAKDFVAARKSIARARDIWPDSREARQLLEEIQQENPTVSVGVFEASPATPHRRIDDWAAVRTSGLRQPMLAEMVGFGSEGGVYRSPFGVWQPNASGTRLSLEMNSRGNESSGSGAGANSPSAADIARALLNLADPSRPEYDADFADVVAGVSIEGGDTVHIDWKHPLVRPEALLQRPLAELSALLDQSRWRLADDSPQTKILEASNGEVAWRPWLRTIVEQTLKDDRAALEALRRGEIDVLDRVPPWQLSRLRATAGIRVESYALPTVHALVLNPESELLQHREFRRAICFAIPRERILKEVLLGGSEAAGFTVLSGPLPAGLSLSDPLSYAYDSRIEPRPFEPRLAAVLASVAWAKIIDPSGKGEVESQPIPTLVLAHPADPVARLACESIQIQLTRAGIPIKLVEFTADELEAGKVKYDMRYAEMAIWEPVVDARAVLG
ncbi:MAG: ABC transporter substrate-binding protein, partial [Pirellulales bacterium]